MHRVSRRVSAAHVRFVASLGPASHHTRLVSSSARSHVCSSATVPPQLSVIRRGLATKTTSAPFIVEMPEQFCGRVTKWLKAVGDSIKEDEGLCEIETEVNMPAFRRCSSLFRPDLGIGAAFRVAFPRCVTALHRPYRLRLNRLVTGLWRNCWWSQTLRSKATTSWLCWCPPKKTWTSSLRRSARCSFHWFWSVVCRGCACK
jgi:hypothetical protein